MRIGRAGLSLLALLATMTVASPASAQDKMVNCKDGSTSKGGRGACSGHGGVADAAPAKKGDAKTDAKAPKADAKAMKADAKMDAKAPKADAKMDAKAPKADAKMDKAPKADAKPAAKPAAAGEGKPTAKCKDGSMSFAKNHTGACSSHGGVAEWLDGTAKKP
jgi:hypothetical protein